MTRVILDIGHITQRGMLFKKRRLKAALKMTVVTSSDILLYYFGLLFVELPDTKGIILALYRHIKRHNMCLEHSSLYYFRLLFCWAALYQGAILALRRHIKWHNMCLECLCYQKHLYPWGEVQILGNCLWLAGLAGCVWCPNVTLVIGCDHCHFEGGLLW